MRYNFCPMLRSKASGCTRLFVFLVDIIAVVFQVTVFFIILGTHYVSNESAGKTHSTSYDLSFFLYKEMITWIIMVHPNKLYSICNAHDEWIVTSSRGFHQCQVEGRQWLPLKLRPLYTNIWEPVAEKRHCSVLMKRTLVVQLQALSVPVVVDW